MEFLVESFPFVFGMLLGATVHRFGGLRQHWAAWAAACAGLGAFATVCSGEYRVSPWYFAFDIALVAAVSVAAVTLLELRRRRRL